MWPSFTLPGLGVPVSTYHFLHVVAWFAFYFAGTALTRSRADLRRHWIWLAVGLAFCDTVGARLAFGFVRGWHGDGFFGGPLLFALLTAAYVVSRRVHAYPFLDTWAVAFSVSHVFEKGACLAMGCCFGRPTSSILGVALHAAHGDPTRSHPLPLYEASLHLLTAGFLGLLYARGWLKGRLVIILGLTYGGWRSAMELARSGLDSTFLGGPLTITQVACLMAIVFSATYLLSGSAGARRAGSPT